MPKKTNKPEKSAARGPKASANGKGKAKHLPPAPKKKASLSARVPSPAPQPAKAAGLKPAAAAAPGPTPSRILARTPVGAEELKAKLGKLASAVNEIKGLKRGMSKSFYGIGRILKEIEDKRLFEAKGYGSFDAFLEREIDLGKQLSLRLVQIVETFIEPAAIAVGLDRAVAGLAAMFGEETPTSDSQPPPPGLPTRSAIPIHKQ